MTVRSTVLGMGNRANPAFAVGAVAVPLAAFALAATVGTREMLTYVHVISGVMWTGIDVFMAAVIGPVLGALSVEERASWFERFTPKMAFLMPTLATVTVFSGIVLAVRIGAFPNAGPWTATFFFTAFVTATLLMGWVFDSFDDRRWQAFFAVVLVGNGAYLVTEVVGAGAGAGMSLPGTRLIIVLILAIMVVLVVQGFGFLMPNEVLIYLETLSESPDKERVGRLGMRNARLSGVQGVFQLFIVLLMVYLRWGGF